MAENVFAHTPLQNALGREAAAMEARKARGILPTTATTPPSEPLKSAPSAPEAPKTPRLVYEDASSRYGVQANLIRAVAEMAAIPDDQAGAAADRIGETLSGPIKQGMKASEALRSLFPDAPEGFEQAVVTRANEIFAADYAPAETPAAPEEDGSFVGDAARTLGGSLVRGVGSAVRGVGDAIEAVNDATRAPFNALTGQDVQGVHLTEDAADIIQSYAKGIGEGVSEDAKQAIRDSSPDGDLFRPSTWTVGEKPSLKGYSLLALDVFGSLAPVVAAAYVSGPGAAAGVGGLQGGGAGGEAAGEMIDQMAAEKLPDGRSRLEVESAYYREMVAAGLPAAAALRRTKAAAARMGFIFTAPISTLGGAATGVILQPATKIAARSGLPGRVAGRVALGALEEGSQEAAETIHARSGGNVGAGTNESVSDGTFGDFLLGAMGGAGPAAISGALSSREEVPVPAAEGPAQPVADSVETDGLPAQDVVSDAGVEASKGPLSNAMKGAPAPLAPDIRPGDRVTLHATDLSPIDGTFVSEEPDGVVVKADGEDLLIPREEFERGAVSIQPFAPAPDGLAAEAAPVAPPAPREEEPAELTPEAAAERLAERQRLEAIINPPPPAPTPTEAVTRKDGSAFKTLGQAMQAVRSRGFEVEAFSFDRQADGGIIANPKQADMGVPISEEPAPAPAEVAAAPAVSADPAQAETGAVGEPAPVSPTIMTPREMRSDLESHFDGHADAQAKAVKEQVRRHLADGGRVFVVAEGKDREIVSVDGLGMKDRNGNPWGITGLLMVPDADMDKPALRFEPPAQEPAVVAAEEEPAGASAAPVEEAAEGASSAPKKLAFTDFLRALPKDPTRKPDAGGAGARVMEAVGAAGGDWNNLTDEQRASAIELAKAEKYVPRKKGKAAKAAPKNIQGASAGGEPTPEASAPAQPVASTEATEPPAAGEPAEAAPSVPAGGETPPATSDTGPDEPDPDGSPTGRAGSASPEASAEGAASPSAPRPEITQLREKAGEVRGISQEQADSIMRDLGIRMAPSKGGFTFSWKHEKRVRVAVKDYAGAADMEAPADTADSRIAARNAMLPKGYRLAYDGGGRNLHLFGPEGQIVSALAGSFATMSPRQQAEVLDKAQRIAANRSQRKEEANLAAPVEAAEPDLDAMFDDLLDELAPEAKPAKVRAAVLKGNAPANDQPMADYTGKVIDASDDHTSDDGRNSPTKNAFKDDAMRFSRAVAARLKERGFEPATDRKGKPKAVRWNASGPATSGDVYLEMVGPDGVGFLMEIGQTFMSRGLTLRLVAQPKEGQQGPNNFLSDKLRPSEVAERIAKHVATAVARAQAQAAPAAAAPETATEIVGKMVAEGFHLGQDGKSAFRNLRRGGQTSIYVVKPLPAGTPGVRLFRMNATDDDGGMPNTEFGNASTFVDALRIAREKGAFDEAWTVEPAVKVKAPAAAPAGKIGKGSIVSARLNASDRWVRATVIDEVGETSSLEYQVRTEDGIEFWVTPDRIRGGATVAAPDLPPPPVKLPAGFFQTYAKPMTKDEAAGTDYPPRTIKAIITRQTPFSAIDGYGATVNEALDHAARQARAQLAKEEARKPAAAPADDLDAMFDDLLDELAPEAKPAATSTPDEIKAARKDVDERPTEGQKEAGNYAMGHIKVHGLDVTIETRKGGWRRGTSPDGTEWKVRLAADYGYIRRTEGADGDHLDVYVGDFPERDQAYVFDQYGLGKHDGFDEHKIVLGASGVEDAVRIYDAGFSDRSGSNRRRSDPPLPLTVDELKEWLRSGDTRKPVRDRKPGRIVPGLANVLRDIEDMEVDAGETITWRGNDGSTDDGYQIYRDGPSGTLVGNPNNEVILQDREELTDAQILKAISDHRQGRRTPAPAPKPASTAPRKAGEAASSAVKNAAMGIDEATKGLLEIFGGKDRLSAGLTFDRATYEKAKPLFIAAARHFKAAAGDIREVMGAVMKHLMASGLDREGLRAMQPYVVEFTREVGDGAIDLDAEEAADDAERDDGDNAEPLEDALPQGSAGPRSEGGRPAGDRSGEADAEGDGYADPDRSGSGDSVVRLQDPVLPGAAASPGSHLALANGPVSRTEDRPNHVAGENPGNYRITEADQLGQATASKKVEANLAAIRLLKQIQKEGRFATPAEQAVLARYVGWGGLKSVFDVKKKDATDFYGRAYRELQELLTKPEYEDAFDSVRNAHYTAEGVVNAMWRAVRHFGFRGGRALEPTMGVGNFLGLQPADMAGATEWHGAELDTITGGIAKLLYPEANVFGGVGFEKAPFADGVFDIAIGNPPFGSNMITDKVKSRAHLSGMKVHNYVISKTAMHLRPGGVMAMVVTHRFLDTADAEARAVLSKDFAFLGAVRLPNDAFKANAGTEVTTDIIFLRKLRADEKPDLEADWLRTDGKVPAKNGGEARVNGYFEKNPGHILGESATDGTMYGGRGGEYTVHGDGRDVGAAIDEILATDWKGLAGALDERPQDADVAAVNAVLSTSTLPVGGMALTEDGSIVRRDMDDEHGNAVVETITPESFWRDMAAEWNAAGNIVERIKAETEGLKVPSVEIVDEFNAVLPVALNADGSRRPSPTKAEKALYDVADALARPDSFEWTHDEALAEVRASAARRRLGEDGFMRLKGLLGLRRGVLDLMAAERADATDLDARREAMNAAYDAFVAKHGFISEPRTVGLLGGDVGPELGLEASYTAPMTAKEAKEKGVQPQKASATKADILKSRVFFPVKEITSAKDVDDGLRISLSERGKVDFTLIARLVGKRVKAVIEELTGGDEPRVFFDPESSTYEDAEAYLSGNVKHKIEVARKAGRDANVRALAKVQPEPKTKERITPTIRSQWIPRGVFEEFLADLGVTKPQVHLLASIGKMEAVGEGFTRTDFGQQFQHADEGLNAKADVVKMFNALAAGKTLTIYDRVDRDKVEVNQAATAAVNATMERIAEVFGEWAYSDPERTKLVVDAFNEKMNTHRPRTYDGRKYLRLVGANPSVSLRRTQMDAAWRMILEKSVLLDHVVGAGKTYTIAAAMMERRRLGLSRKPMIVVPNHLVVQWAREFYHLYPGAKILAATPDDFSKSNRRRLLARIATGDYDAVIVGHSSLGFIETPAEDVELVVQEKMDQIRSALDEARANGDSKRSLTQIRNRIEKYEDRLEELRERTVDEIGVTMSDMGVDYLATDEAQEFKNLEYATGGERVVGMNDPIGSKKAFDLYVKMRGLQARGGGTAFATGTPVSNSLVELFTVMDYLAHDELVKRGQAHFDAWSAAYTQTQTRLEYTATQKIKPRRVLSGLTNLSALHQLYGHFADTITRKDLERIHAEDVAARNARDGTNLSTRFPVPKVAGGGRRLASGPITPLQSEFMDYLVARMDAIHENRANRDYAKIDNPLWVLSDARKMSLDIRTVDPVAERDENGKVARAAGEIKRIYDRWNDDLGTQMVFCDLSTPSKGAEKEAKRLLRDVAGKVMGEGRAKGWLKQNEWRSFATRWELLMDAMEEAAETLDADVVEKVQQERGDAEAAMFTADTGFSVYDDLKAALMEQGIPDREIAFIHDFNTPEQKLKLFDRVNAGQVRVLLGSSMKMGAGTNAQKRLVAEHHMDAPWRPSDVEQREGRIIRQGNTLYARDPDGFEVEIIAYSTAGTSDTVMWQVLERKAGAIEQFRSGSIDRVEEEVANDSDTYAEFMATSTGNPVFRLKLEAERDLVRQKSEVGGLLLAQNNARRFLDRYDGALREAEEMIAFGSAAKPDEFRYGDEGSTAEEFEAAQAQVIADYRDAQAKFLEADAKAMAARKEEEAAGVPGKEMTKRPTKPAAPSLTGPTMTKASSYVRAINGILADLDNRAADGPGIEVEIGNVEVQLRKRRSIFDGMFAFIASIKVGGEWREQTVNYAKTAVTLADYLVPSEIRDIAERMGRNAARRRDDLKARQAGEKKTAAIEVDRSAVRHTEALVDWYGAQVALAEAEADRARAGKRNRYVEGDRRRPLKTGTATSDTAIHTFSFEGLTFNGTGNSSMVSGGGRWSGATLYEANRSNDGHRAIVVVSGLEDDKKTPKIVTVLIEPEGASEVKHSVEDDSAAEKPFASTAALREHLVALPGIGKFVRQLLDAGFIKLEETPPENENPKTAGSTYLITKEMDPNLPRRVVSRIRLFSSNITPETAAGVVLHEIFHAGGERLLGGAWDPLMARAESIRAAQQKKATDPNHPRFQNAEEFAAYALQYYEQETESRAGLREVLDRMIGELKAFILRHFGRQIGQVTTAEFRAIAAAALRAEAKRRGASSKVQSPRPSSAPATARHSQDADVFKGEAKHSIADQKSFKAPQPAPAMTDAQIDEGERGMIGNALTKAMEGDYGILGLVPGRPLFAELAKGMPAARQYLHQKLEMDALRNHWHARTDEVAQAWRKLGAKSKANADLMDIMHDATLLGADPSQPYVSMLNDRDREALDGPRGGPAWDIATERAEKDAAKKRAWRALKERFDALPPAFKAMFERVRDTYKEIDDATDKAILDNIEKSMERGLRDAERRFKDEMARIRDEGLTGADKIAAETAASEKFAGVKKRHGWSKRARMAKLRAQFEMKKVPAPYFPLARFGSFFVTTRDAETGEVLGFSTFEKPKEQNAFARAERAKDGVTVEVGTLAQAGALRGMVDPVFVADVEAILGDSGVGEGIMDAIWQRWLETLPDLSLRKSKIHRKGTPGFSRDAFRAFGHQMFHGAHQLARLTFAAEMQESLDLAKEQVKNQPDPVRAGLVHQEMARRHDYTMNPKGAWWAQAMTSAAFVYFLAMTPAAAIVNLSQTVVVGVPVLAAGFPEGSAGANIAMAGRQLLRALHDFTAGRGHSESTDRFTQDEKDALAEAYRRGTVDASQAHDLAGVSETGVEYSPLRTRVMGVISWFFHNTERLNREVTFLAAYRMGRAKGMDHTSSIEKASDLTWKTHFDYQNTSRPRLMQNDAARVALTFRNFSINMLWRLFRDVHQSVNAKDAAERKEALVQLGGITGQLFLHAGIKGVWGYSIVIALAGLFFAGGGDDAEDELKKGLLEALGPDLGGMVLNGVPGHLTGLDLTNRMGMPDLWFRSPDRQLEGEDAYQYWLTQLVGAPFGIAENGFRGVSMIREGETWRGIETMAPKFVRDLMRATRYATEGVQTMKGDPILENVDFGKVLAQALGFTPAAISERYDANSKLKNAEQRITDDRGDLMTRAATEVREGKGLSQATVDDIMAFNRRWPTYPITPDSLKQSIRGRIRASARNESGIMLNPKLNDTLRDSAAPLVYE